MRRVWHRAHGRADRLSVFSARGGWSAPAFEAPQVIDGDPIRGALLDDLGFGRAAGRAFARLRCQGGVAAARAPLGVACSRVTDREGCQV